jgi:hypothetical protein
MKIERALSPIVTKCGLHFTPNPNSSKTLNPQCHDQEEGSLTFGPKGMGETMCIKDTKNTYIITYGPNQPNSISIKKHVPNLHP